MSLRIKKIPTGEIKISVAIPPDDPQVRGTFIGNAKIRNKAELKALQERIEREQMDDEAIVRELYADFDKLEDEEGRVLTGEASIQEVVKGELSAFLVPAVVQAYYAQYGEARAGNSRPLRAR